MAIGRKYDVFFLGIVIALLLVGFFVLASASLGMAARADKTSYTPLLKQIMLGGSLGLALLFFASKIHYKNWGKIALPLFIFSFLLMLLVFEPHFGFTHGGAKRWLSFGGFSFQPAELLKFSFVLYLSLWLSKRRKQIASFKTGLLPFLIIVGLAGATLFLQPDMGTLGVITMVAALLFFLAGGRFTQIGLLLVVGFFVLAVAVFARPYLMSRVLVFFDPSYDIQGAGYQLNQAKIAIGSGGIWGRGFGQGLAKYNYLPEPTGDSIFAIIGEEFGFVGTTILIFLFLLFFYKAFGIASQASGSFGRLFGSGIAILIVAQCFVNMYAVVGLIPLTGLPLIFISQGGSALALAMAEVGILLNISKHIS